MLLVLMWIVLCTLCICCGIFSHTLCLVWVKAAGCAESHTWHLSVLITHSFVPWLSVLCCLCGACPSHSPSAFPKLSPVWCMPFSLPVSLPKAVPCVVHALLSPRQPSQSCPLCGACPSHSPSAFPKLSPVWCMPFSLPVSLPEAIPSTLHCMA